MEVSKSHRISVQNRATPYLSPNSDAHWLNPKVDWHLILYCLKLLPQHNDNGLGYPFTYHLLQSLLASWCKISFFSKLNPIFKKKTTPIYWKITDQTPIGSDETLELLRRSHQFICPKLPVAGPPCPHDTIRICLEIKRAKSSGI